MPKLKLSDARTKALRRDWVAGRDSVSELAQRYGVAAGTVRNYARRHKWPLRGSSSHDRVLAAQLLHRQVAADLQNSCARLRVAEPRETVADAIDRRRLLRLHQKTLADLLAMDLDTPKGGSPAEEPADHEAAIRRVLAWLENAVPQNDAA